MGQQINCQDIDEEITKATVKRFSKYDITPKTVALQIFDVHVPAQVKGKYGSYYAGSRQR